MEEYKAIMKLIDSKLAEQESVIEYYRNKQKEWEEHSNELTLKVLQLEAVNDDYIKENEKLKEEIEKLKEKIDELTF